MSLVNLSHVCSHLQNASLARLGLTSIPYSRLHLSLSLLLHKQGFFSSVKLGGPSPPASCFPPGLRDGHSVTAHPYPKLENKGESARETILRKMVMQGANEEDLLAEGFEKDDVEWAAIYKHYTPYQLKTEGVEIEAMGLSIQNQPIELAPERFDDPDALDAEGVVTQTNRASRRLWLGMKYWDGLPVLRKAQMVSKPTKRLWLDHRDLARIVRGGRAGEVKGMTQIGEIMAISTDKGIMDARECVERRIGGQALCRVW